MTALVLVNAKQLDTDVDVVTVFEELSNIVICPFSGSIHLN